MKSKSLILLVISMGFGLVAAIGISQVMGRNEARPEPQRRMRPVVVALEHLDHRVELTAENVRVEKWPESIVPEGAASSIEEVLDRCVVTRVVKGLPIMLRDVVDPKELARLAIPPGYKIVTINVAADNHFGGLLAPGDRVDVVGVFGSRGCAEPMSRTFLRNVRVFSVNNRTRPDGERGSDVRSNNTIVGILLTEQQSEQLLLVEKLASIRLVLRGDGEEYDRLAEGSLPDSEGFSLSDWLRGETSASSPPGAGLLRYLNQVSDSLATREVSRQHDSLHRTIVYTHDGPVVYTWDEDGLPRRTQGYPSSHAGPGFHDPLLGAESGAPDPESGVLSDGEGDTDWTDRGEDWE